MLKLASKKIAPEEARLPERTSGWYQGGVREEYMFTLGVVVSDERKKRRKGK